MSLFLNVAGIIVSLFYFFSLLLISAKIPFKTKEAQRKFVHILLGNWWFIVLLFFDSAIFASIVPCFFIFYFSIERKKPNSPVASLERNYKSHGLLLFPASMWMLVLLSFYIFKDVRWGGMGLLALAYGDGIAALVGKRLKFGEMIIFGSKKSVAGSSAMLVTTFVVISVYMYAVGLCTSLSQNLLCSFVAAFGATLAEMCTPLGIDNFTVPLSTTFICSLFLYV